MIVQGFFIFYDDPPTKTYLQQITDIVTEPLGKDGLPCQ